MTEIEEYERACENAWDKVKVLFIYVQKGKAHVGHRSRHATGSHVIASNGTRNHLSLWIKLKMERNITPCRSAWKMERLRRSKDEHRHQTNSLQNSVSQ